MESVRGARDAASVESSSPISRLIVRPAVGISAEAPVAEAARLMELAGVSALLVGEDSGIVTERDLARGLGAGCSPYDPVSAVATPHPLAVDGSMEVVEAAALMLNEQVRHLIVFLPEGGRGVISIRDLLAVLLEAADGHRWLTSLRVAIGSPAEIWLG